MTRAEITNTRDLAFSGWIRKSLPDSSFGFLVTDLDFILYNYETKKFMLLEIKTRGAKLKNWQNNIFQDLSRWLQKGIDNGWQFLGFHVVTFENEFFHDGKCFWDGEEINEEELKTKLSKI